MEPREREMEECKSTVVYMCGYLPGVPPEKSPILTPVPVHFPIHDSDSWKDVCGGGCGFAMAVSECGKLITWGSADDEGQTYVTCGKHGETPEVFALPSDASVVKAIAGWAHCVSVTETGEVYTWGWKECVPLVKPVLDSSSQNDNNRTQEGYLAEQVSPKSHGSTGGTGYNSDTSKAGEDNVKRRKVSPAKEECEIPQSGDDFFTVSPSLVALGPGVRITSVAAGARHTLAMSGLGLGLRRRRTIRFGIPDKNGVFSSSHTMR